MMSTGYMYLHGFASGPDAFKGTRLREAFARSGITLHLPDLNRPSFGELTFGGALESINELVEQEAHERWSIIGSSMGGYLACLWAFQNPARVRRLLLLCPGFGLVERWPSMMGEEAFARWEKVGAHPFADGQGKIVNLSFTFIEDARKWPTTPLSPCPTRIIHGTKDEVVPVEVSRRYASDWDHVHLKEVDDDHGLVASIDFIQEQAFEFFHIEEA